MTEFAGRVFVNAHQAAWDKALAKAPELEVNKLIRIGADLLLGKKEINEIVKDLSAEYGPAVKEYLENFSDQAIRNALQESNEETLMKLAEGDFAEMLKKTTVRVADLVFKYMKRDIGEVQFIDGLLNCGFKELGAEFLQAGGVSKEVLFEADGSLRSFASPAIGYCATVQAYKMMMKALDEASEAYEQRLRVEEESRKTIELIREYRAEMEKAVNKYLTRHYETFDHAIDIMNKALLENDSDGYIKGNVEIQKLFGYDVQFTNQDEFDDLMDSDIALKL